MMTSLQAVGAAGCQAAFQRYRAGAGELAAYVSPVTHASLAMLARTGGDLPLAMGQRPASLAEQVPPLGPHQLLVIEAAHPTAIQTGLDLAAQRAIWPILTSRLRYHPSGLLGDPLTASLLLLEHPEAAERRGWSLVVDIDRNPPGPCPTERYDNRQPYHYGDLPLAEDLDRVGIREVCLLSDATEERHRFPGDDLCDWLATLARPRISVVWLEMR